MTTTASSRRTRVDAARNRAHILSVAEEGFAEEGVDLAMDAIAKRSGVGAGTLYRHFPTRESLVAAVLEGHFLELDRQRATITEDQTDSLRALERWLDAVSVWMRAYEGLTGPLSAAHRNQTSPLAPTCHQVIAATGSFLEAAQRDGYARPGVSARDLFMATLAVTWVEHSAADTDGSESGVRDILRSGWAATPVIGGLG